jgi:hypothetical protein
MPPLTWFSLLSLLFLDFLACSQKRNPKDNVHAMGAPQKRLRKEKDPFVSNQKESDDPKEVPSNPSSASVLDPGNLSTPPAMNATTDKGSNVSKQEQPCPVPLEQKSSLQMPALSAWWSQYREGLKRITLDGQDVAVTLYESESFLLDLPFLECVLPSMRSRELYFVPVFIQKVLLPYWRNGRKVFSDQEYKILKLCRAHFFIATNAYLEMLFLAAALEDPLEEGTNTMRLGNKALELVTCIRAFFEVRPLDDFLSGEQTLDNVKARLARRIRRIPALLMIGQQWGFDAKKIAAKIKRMGCINTVEEDIRNLDVFLDAVINGIRLPDLREWSVTWIAWTMKPDFSCSADPDTGEQLMLPRVRFECTDGFIRPASSSPSREGKHTIKSILANLELKQLKCNPLNVPAGPAVASSSEFKSAADAPLLSSSLNQHRPILAGSTNALRMASIPRFQPSVKAEPEIPRPVPVFSNVPKRDEEILDSPTPCLSEFNEDPLDLFDPAVVLGNPSTDYDPVRENGLLDDGHPEVTDFFDFIEEYYATQQ